MEHLRRARAASALNIFLGLVLFITPFVFGLTQRSDVTVNSLLLGAVVFLLAFIRASIPQKSSWMSWANFVLGLWLIISPFVLNFDSQFAFWTTVILGTMIAVLSLSSIIETHKGLATRQL